MTNRPLQEKGFIFDEKEHVYTLDGRPLHGVTSILSVIAKPALIQWSADEVCKYIVENSPIQQTVQESMAKEFSYIVSGEILKEARIAHRKKKEEAPSKLGFGIL